MTAALKDAVHAVDAAAVLGLLPGRPRLLALGEPTHGEDVLLEVRNDLFRQLVSDYGFRTITIESDCLMGLIVDDYVTGASELGLDAVMERGFSHGFGASPANRELVRWMRSYNEGRPADSQLHFAGFDGPLEMAAAASPRQALTALHHSLAGLLSGTGLLPCSLETLDRLLGADERWNNPATMRDPSQSIGRTPAAAQLRLFADDLAALLDTQTPQLIRTSSWDRAQLYARTATGLLRYHHWMADTSPSRLAQLLGVRSSMMAANLLATPGPALAFAQNAHFQRPRSSIRMGGDPVEWWSAGAIAGAHLGPDYAVVAMALGTIRHRGVDTPPPDTIEGLLYALPSDRYVVDPRRLAQLPVAPRVSPWFGYAPLDPAHLTSNDAIVYVKDAAEGEPWWG